MNTRNSNTSLPEKFSVDRRRWMLSSATAATALSGWSPSVRAQESQLATRTTTVARGKQGVVATVHPLASQAAMAAYERGGNAIDAAAAASVMLSVVDGFNSGIGGGCLALVRTSSGKVHAIDGREKAPAAAKPEMFYRDGKPDPQLSQVGPLAAGVPGLLSALDRLVRTHGAIDWSDALAGAAAVARDGFILDSNYVSRLRGVAKTLKRFPASAKILLDSSGQPWAAGHRLVQSDLAHTFEQLAQNGIDWFYKGEFAESTERFMKSEAGMLTADDFANYNCVARQPIQSEYRGHQVFG
ncbi:MAG: gamma-glutamyltransferase, partial [Planctomycetota bacterium]